MRNFQFWWSCSELSALFWVKRPDDYFYHSQVRHCLKFSPGLCPRHTGETWSDKHCPHQDDVRTTDPGQESSPRTTYDALDIVLKVLLKGASTSRGFHTENITCETEMCFKQTVFCMLCYEFWIFYHFCSIISSFLIIFHRYDCLMDVLRTRFTFCLSYRQKHAKKSSKWL